MSTIRLSIGMRTTLPPRASTVSRPTMASAAQSAPFTRTSGCSRSMIAAGVSSSNTTTASTQASASRTSARSCSGMIGLTGPLLARTDRSELMPTIEHVALGAGGLQIADVTRVQQIEHPVREHDASAQSAPWPRRTSPPRRNRTARQRFGVDRRTPPSNVQRDAGDRCRRPCVRDLMRKVCSRR